MRWEEVEFLALLFSLSSLLTLSWQEESELTPYGYEQDTAHDETASSVGPLPCSDRKDAESDLDGDMASVGSSQKDHKES